MSMKNSNDTIGNRNRDLQTCRAVPQPTAPPSITIVGKRLKGEEEENKEEGDGKEERRDKK
jgi:hypothetical protein